MNRIFQISLVLGVCMPALVGNATEKHPPNIVVILSDDFGTGDVHALYPSNRLATPNLDRLVSEGMCFTDAHSGSALCTPSRYGLLTGRYSWRTALQYWVLAPYEPPLIAEDRVTLPAFLKQHGYHTACFGKWHLGWHWPGPEEARRDEQRGAMMNVKWDFSKPIRGGPTERGFDTYFGVDLPNYPPLTFIENDHVAVLPSVPFPGNPKNKIKGGGFTGWPSAPGWKLDRVLPEITRWAVQYIHSQAETKQPFFLYFSLTAPHTPIAPSKKFAGKSGVAPIVDYLMEVDWSAGQVMQAIADAKISDDTILIFAGDNGPALHGDAQTLINANIKRSGFYRGAKGDIWEGGHREPLIIRWPGHIKDNRKSDQLVCLNDLFATCAEVIGVPLPVDAAEDSISFLPTVLGKASAGNARTNLVNHSGPGEFAYRDGDWKLVFKMTDNKETLQKDVPTVAQLYNLREDRTEKHNVAAQHTEIVKELTAKLQSAIDDGGTRRGSQGKNDRKIRFDIAPLKRWAPTLN